MRALPNLITLLRLLSAPLLVWLLTQSYFRTALAVTLLAGVTDWLDGYAARKLHSGGNLGVVFDPLADKVLLVTLFIALSLVHLIPLWMLALAIGRDLVIVAGALLVRAFRGIKQFRPSLLGKISTFFQIVYILFVLCCAAFDYERLLLLRDAALVCCAIFTGLSGLNYVRIGVQLARRSRTEPALTGS